MDANGIVNVKAGDEGTGKQQSVTITASTILSDDQIDKAVKEAEKYAEEDKKRKEMVDARNDADQMIYATEKAMEEAGDKISEEDKKTLEEAVKKAKEEVAKAEDAESVRKVIDEMGKETAPVFTKLYQAQQAAQQSGEGDTNGGSNGDNNGGDDTINDND